jgi:hypothetical protein
LIVFFICYVQNIFIAIVQDGFNSLKERPIKTSMMSTRTTRKNPSKAQALHEISNAFTLSSGLDLTSEK